MIAAGAAGDAPQPPVGDRKELPSPIALPDWVAATEKKSSGPPTALPPGARTGYAIVGLGRLALEQILPAFAKCKRSRSVALVSGDPAKAAKVADQYGIGPKHLYDYKSFDRIRDDPDVEVVYIVLPNSMHLEFTARAASAGKHVLSEKPMATSSAECRQMIDACNRAGRTLMVAYRCQYEPYNRALTAIARTRELGAVRLINAENVQNMADPSQWRLRRALAGGGSLPDIGIYCLNACRYLTGEEPVEVSAMIQSPADDPRFREVEDRVAFQLRFPSGVLASCQSGYSAHESRRLRLLGESGWAELDPAFSYKGLRLHVGRVGGKAEVVSERRLDEADQFAAEIDHMSERLAEGRRPRTPGEEGLQDHRLMEAIYESAREGRPVRLDPVPGLDTTRGPALPEPTP